MHRFAHGWVNHLGWDDDLDNMESSNSQPLFGSCNSDTSDDDSSQYKDQHEAHPEQPSVTEITSASSSQAPTHHALSPMMDTPEQSTETGQPTLRSNSPPASQPAEPAPPLVPRPVKPSSQSTSQPPQSTPQPAPRLYHGATNSELNPRLVELTERDNGLSVREAVRDAHNYQQAGQLPSSKSGFPAAPSGPSGQSQGNGNVPQTVEPGIPNPPADPAPKERKTVRRFACEQCRKAHEKCDGAGEAPCSRCVKRNVPCVVTGKDKRDNATIRTALASLRDEIQYQVNLLGSALLRMVDIDPLEDSSPLNGLIARSERMMNDFERALPLDRVINGNEVSEFVLPDHFQNYWRGITDDGMTLEERRRSLANARRDGAELLAALEYLGERFVADQNTNARWFLARMLDRGQLVGLQLPNNFRATPNSEGRSRAWFEELQEDGSFQRGRRRRRRSRRGLNRRNGM
ncbi:hypothetical protein F5Y16DRAFT_396150 [Xylariaceae sp. FL0255]|nr:hypothetical protein F5Y16DRAFT_396150 [Xylariaceae sp. FL0255]